MTVWNTEGRGEKEDLWWGITKKRMPEREPQINGVLDEVGWGAAKQMGRTRRGAIDGKGCRRGFETRLPGVQKAGLHWDSWWDDGHIDPPSSFRHNALGLFLHGHMR